MFNLPNLYPLFSKVAVLSGCGCNGKAQTDFGDGVVVVVVGRGVVVVVGTVSKQIMPISNRYLSICQLAPVVQLVRTSSIMRVVMSSSPD